MKLTKLHLDYWRQKKAPMPAWGLAVAAKERLVSVDDLVNAQVWRNAAECRLEAHNLLVILRSARKRGRGELLYVLARCATDRGGIHREGYRRRRAYAAKWLARLGESVERVFAGECEHGHSYMDPCGRCYRNSLEVAS